MLLAIDVGNTNIVIGVFRGETLVHSWRLTTIRERTSDELGILLTDHNVSETLALCDRAYVLLDGHVLAHGTPSELATHDEVRRYFLGESFTLTGV